MTDFKAPPPPPEGFEHEEAPATPVVQPETPIPPVENAGAPEATQQKPSDEWVNKIQEQKDKVLETYNKIPTSKRPLVWTAAAFVVGLLLGGMMFGGSSEAPVTTKDLRGIVPNPEIKDTLKRCGQVDPSSACVLYVMNDKTYDKLAEDFFDLAVQISTRRYELIKSDNLRYATTRIKPGYFAQIKIPARR